MNGLEVADTPDELDTEEQNLNPGTSDGEVDKLVDWENPPTVANLKDDLMVATPIHSAQIAKINRWNDNLRVEGKAKVKSGKNNSSIVPKLIRKQAEWRYPALSEPFLSTYDIFTTKPKSWEDKKAAEQNALVLNYQFNAHVDKVRFIDEYVRAAVDDGTVIVQVGWEFEEEEYTEEQPVYEYQVDPGFQPTLEQVLQIRETSPSEFATNVPDELKQALEIFEASGEITRPVDTGTTQSVTKKRVVHNRPTVEVCNIKNVILDPSAMGDMDKANFVIRTRETNLSRLRKDGRYKNLDRIKAEAVNPLSTPDHDSPVAVTGFQLNDEARKIIVIHEYHGFWDIHKTGRVVPIIAVWAGDTMIRLEESPFPDKKVPFVVVPYLVKRGENYGEPDGELLEDNQKVMGAVLRGIIDILGKSAAGQTGMSKAFLDATNERRFEQGLDYKFNPNMDPRAHVYSHVYPEIPASAQWVLEQQSMEAESLTGVKSFSQGVSGQSLGEVAAGVRGALDAASKRELGILRRLADGIVKIGRKFTAMNAVLLSDEEIVRVTNEDFVTIRRDDLAGHFDLELSISTAEEDNAKASELSFMLQTSAPNDDPAITRMIRADIAKLRKMPDLAQRLEEYEPKPDPVQQQIAQLEVMKLQAEIAEIQARTASLASTSNLNDARANTEMARAEHLDSQTDLNTLEFVEQENGVHHARDMQRQGAQASAQARTKIIESGLQASENEKNRQTDLLKEYLKQKSKKA